MKNTTPTGRLWRVLALYAALTLTLVLYVTYFSHGGHGLPCPLLLLTGLQCPACGMTRAAAALLRLDFTAAFSYHALWPLYAAYLLWVAVADAVAYVRREVVHVLPSPSWLHTAVLALTIAYGVLRNLPL